MKQAIGLLLILLLIFYVCLLLAEEQCKTWGYEELSFDGSFNLFCTRSMDGVKVSTPYFSLAMGDAVK